MTNPKTIEMTKPHHNQNTCYLLALATILITTAISIELNILVQQTSKVTKDRITSNLHYKKPTNTAESIEHINSKTFLTYQNIKKEIQNANSKAEITETESANKLTDQISEQRIKILTQDTDISKFLPIFNTIQRKNKQINIEKTEIENKNNQLTLTIQASIIHS